MLSLTPWKKSFSPVDGSRMLPFTSLGRELDPMFGRLLDGLWGDGASADPLRLEVRETDEQYLVRAEVPGLDPKDLDIQLQGDVLVLSGEKRAEANEERGTLTYSERAYGTFRRAVRLPAPIDAEHVQAKHAHGVVTITLPKAESTRPRRIQVESR